MKKAIIPFFLIVIMAGAAPQKIKCRKFTGKYQDWRIAVAYNAAGKMEIHTEKGVGQGSYSSLGSYTIKGKELGFFYRGRHRTAELKKHSLVAVPFTFDISDNFRDSIVLKEDRSYLKVCQ